MKTPRDSVRRVWDEIELSSEPEDMFDEMFHDPFDSEEMFESMSMADGEERDF